MGSNRTLTCLTRFSGYVFLHCLHQHETRPRSDACPFRDSVAPAPPFPNNRPESRHPKTTVVVKQGSSCMNLEAWLDIHGFRRGLSLKGGRVRTVRNRVKAVSVFGDVPPVCIWKPLRRKLCYESSRVKVTGFRHGTCDSLKSFQPPCTQTRSRKPSKSHQI